MTLITTQNERYVDYLDFTTSTWKRPEGPTKIWRIIDGRRKTANGDIPRFSIQEVPKELEEDVIEFMVKHFVPEEPIAVAQGLNQDHFALCEVRTLWRDLLSQGVSVVALIVNPDPSVKPVIAGVNILGIVTEEDETNDTGTSQLFRTPIMRTIMNFLDNLIKESNVFERYGVDKYLTAFGLSVDPFFRGQNLGAELLRARNDIGLAYQIPVSETVFTANTSQFLAARVGFEVLIERKYAEFLDEKGILAFPGIDVELVKVMGKRLY